MSSRLDAAKVLFAGVCSLILTVGFARFAYTPLLPIMKHQTWLTDVAGGWLAAVNYFGYMTGALLAASISSLKTKFYLFRGGLIIGVLSTAAMGLTTNMPLWLVLRFIAGLSSATGMLIVSGLVLNWLIRNGRKPELGIHFAGVGAGIIASGVVVYLVSSWANWAEQWLIFGALGVVLMIPAWAWLPAPIISQGTGTTTPVPPTGPWMRLLIAAYFCAGFGYVIDATFIVAIVEKLPLLAGHGSLVWVLVGLAATPACPLWDRMARRYGDIPTLMFAYALQIVSILLPALTDNPTAALISAILYGATFIGIVSLTLTLIGRFYPANPAKAMARLTLSYGVAQVIAPAIAGYIAQHSGSYHGALYITAVVMVVGVVLLQALNRQASAVVV